MPKQKGSQRGPRDAGAAAKKADDAQAGAAQAGAARQGVPVDLRNIPGNIGPDVFWGIPFEQVDKQEDADVCFGPAPGRASPVQVHVAGGSNVAGTDSPAAGARPSDAPEKSSWQDVVAVLVKACAKDVSLIPERFRALQCFLQASELPTILPEELSRLLPGINIEMLQEHRTQICNNAEDFTRAQNTVQKDIKRLGLQLPQDCGVFELLQMMLAADIDSATAMELVSLDVTRPNNASKLWLLAMICKCAKTYRDHYGLQRDFERAEKLCKSRAGVRRDAIDACIKTSDMGDLKAKIEEMLRLYTRASNTPEFSAYKFGDALSEAVVEKIYLCWTSVRGPESRQDDNKDLSICTQGEFFSVLLCYISLTMGEQLGKQVKRMSVLNTSFAQLRLKVQEERAATAQGKQDLQAAITKNTACAKELAAANKKVLHTHEMLERLVEGHGRELREQQRRHENELAKQLEKQERLHAEELQKQQKQQKQVEDLQKQVVDLQDTIDALLECTICRGTLGTGTKQRVRLLCGHGNFCQACIEALTTFRCPMCFVCFPPHTWQPLYI